MGFAAETEALEKNALRKLREKQCDLICANDVTRMDTGFDADSNELTLFFRDGSRREIPRALKTEIARAARRNLQLACRKALTICNSFNSQRTRSNADHQFLTLRNCG